jgi:hypothetical protein
MHSFTYLTIAREATQRASEAFAQNSAVMLPDALIAITMSAFAVEAFINEVAVLADMEARMTTTEQGRFRSLANILDEIESSRGPTPLKYQAAALVLSGETFPKGEAPFQPFTELVRLRDLLVHPKPLDRRPDSSGFTAASTLIQNFDQRGLTRRHQAGTPRMPWLSELQSVPLARWANDSAGNIIDAIRSMIPANVVIIGAAVS